MTDFTRSSGVKEISKITVHLQCAAEYRENPSNDSADSLAKDVVGSEMIYRLSRLRALTISSSIDEAGFYVAFRVFTVSLMVHDLDFHAKKAEGFQLLSP